MRFSWMAVAAVAMAAGAVAAIIGAGEFRESTSSHGALDVASATQAVRVKADPVGAGIITTIAGNGSPASDGDGGPALEASLGNPDSLIADGLGNLYFVNERQVRRIGADGRITTVAGNGHWYVTPRGEVPVGDGGPAIDAGFNAIGGLAADALGNLYVADVDDKRIRQVTPDGIIRTIAGIGPDGEGMSAYAGEGGPAIQAALVRPSRLVVDSAGNVVFVDGYQIRRITADGVLRTIAGTGNQGETGDGGPALQADMEPLDLAIDRQDNLYYISNFSPRVRKIAPTGTITRVAGGGQFGGDPVATSNPLNMPRGLAVDGQGTLYIGVNHHWVLRVSAAGYLDAFAGQNLFSGFAGDGGPALEALLSSSASLAVDPAGNLVIADRSNHRLRRVTPRPPRPTPMGAFAFAPYTEVELGLLPKGSAIVDVTGDRRDDLVVAVSQDSDVRLPDEVQVYVQGADGSLTGPLRQPLPPQSIIATTQDFNRDGRMDVVFQSHRSGAIGPGVGSVSVGFGTPSGTLQMVVLAARGGPGIDNPVALDANRDGLVDIVVSERYGTRGLSVHYADGQGGFAPPQPLASPIPSADGLHTADFNADGLPDLAAYHWIDDWGTQKLEVLTQRADRSFPSVQAFDVPYAFQIATPGDFNGDGLSDLIHTPAVGSDHPLALRLQRPTGGLGTPLSIPAGHEPRVLSAADVNGDGLDDLLVGRGFLGGLGYLPQRDGALQEEVRFAVPGEYLNSVGWFSMSSGDVNGDGCRDVAMSQGGTSILVYHGQSCRLPQIARDLDGDRRADIVWRNQATGANELWRAGLVTWRQVLSPQPVEWKVAATGDFDGNGKSDLFWRNAVSGANSIWRSGLSQQSMAVAPETGSAWQVAGAGDFDNDGRDDLFWRHAGTGANGVWWSANRSTSQSAAPVPDANWQVAGIGDFTGDAKDDVLWRNAATGANDLWPSASKALRRPMTGVTVLAWKVVGVADFNGDRVADILWRHATTGANVLWLYGRATAQRPVATVADVNWQVAGTADYDGDGKADILWRHKLTGGNELWSEGNVRFRKVLTPVTNTAWAVIPK